VELDRKETEGGFLSVSVGTVVKRTGPETGGR
jgi:hypothetical protein